MRIKQYFKKSLSRQFILIMAAFLVSFVVAVTALLVAHHMINQSLITERDQLNKKTQIAEAISDAFNQAFLDSRGYFGFHNQDFKNSALSQEAKIRILERQFNELAEVNDDQQFISEVNAFSNYYFTDTLPSVFHQFENGGQNQVAKITNEQVTQRITTFQKDMKTYLADLKNDSETDFNRMITMQNYTQNILLIVSLFILGTILKIMFKMFRDLGKPLMELAGAANEMASGKAASFSLDTTREDEIGELSRSFHRLVEKVSEKEQDLLAHNEELIAQQDELQAQQLELEEALKTLQENETKLNNRNQIVNQITNTLNKQEVLDSVVVNMCKVINADKGMIAMIKDHSSASFGISPAGVQQFLSHLESGLYEHLLVTKEPFSIRRILEPEEKGYHTGTLYCHDLYLPVLSSEEEIIAVMLFTRYAEPYDSSQMEEFLALAKSIGIILEKLSLFEKSETERKRNQDILNSLQEGVQLIDRRGTIVQTNAHLCDLFSCNGSELLNMPWEEWTCHLERMVETDQFSANMKRIVSQNSEEDHDEKSLIYIMKKPRRVIKVYSRELHHGEVTLGKVLVHRDITKEFEVDRMKSELVSTVSHELRTPLSSILGFTELLLSRELNQDRQKKYLTTILSEGKRLSHLINDFLDVQRMEAGKQTYLEENVPLLPVLTKIIEATQIHTNQRQITLESLSANPMIVGDQGKIEQVFTNLINNAIKYSPNGEKIEVTVTESGKFVKVSVADHGLGIPEESIDKIFNKFYRVDNSDRRKIGGTGLGLSIVQEVVKAHHGEVSVQSQLGKGSNFTVTFPAASENRAKPDEQTVKILG